MNRISDERDHGNAGKKMEDSLLASVIIRDAFLRINIFAFGIGCDACRQTGWRSRNQELAGNSVEA
jgi:hypothetical protein